MICFKKLTWLFEIVWFNAWNSQLIANRLQNLQIPKQTRESFISALISTKFEFWLRLNTVEMNIYLKMYKVSFVFRKEETKYRPINSTRIKKSIDQHLMNRIKYIFNKSEKGWEKKGIKFNLDLNKIFLLEIHL